MANKRIMTPEEKVLLQAKHRLDDAESDSLLIFIPYRLQLWCILREFVFYVVVNQVQNQFLHIQSVFLLESKHTLVVEQESQ